MQYPRRRPPHSISIEGLRTPAPVRAAPPSWGRHPQTFTTTDNRAALREFRRRTIYRTEQLRQNAEKGSALRRAFLCFNATVNIDGALILGTSATY
jgi:hypothetical protein